MLCMRTTQSRAYHCIVSFPKMEKQKVIRPNMRKGRGKEGETRGNATGDEGISCMRVTLGQLFLGKLGIYGKQG